MDVILEVFLIFAGAKAAGELFVRLRLPALAGELLVGVLLGPAVLGWVHIDRASTALADLGIVVLLFAAGLESPIGELVAVGRAALATSVGRRRGDGPRGRSASWWPWGSRADVAAPAALALAATSVGIAARAFGDLGAIGSAPARVVLGAAVVDDVLVLAALPLVQRVGSSGSSVGEVVAGVVGAVAFVRAVAFVGPWLARTRLTELARRAADPAEPVRAGARAVPRARRAGRTGRAGGADRGVPGRHDPRRDRAPPEPREADGAAVRLPGAVLLRGLGGAARPGGARRRRAGVPGGGAGGRAAGEAARGGGRGVRAVRRGSASPWAPACCRAAR